MICLSNLFLETQEQVDMFLAETERVLWEENAPNKELERGMILYSEYINNIFRLSLKLEEDVKKFISDDLYTCVKVPSDDTDNFDSLNFLIISEDGREVRKREMIMFESYCDKYFKSTIGMHSLFSQEFPIDRNLYI